MNNNGIGGINIENHIAQEEEEIKETCPVCNGTGVIQTQEQLEECIKQAFLVDTDAVKLAEEEIEEGGETKCLNCVNGTVEG